jgi:hypothetical protein
MQTKCFLNNKTLILKKPALPKAVAALLSNDQQTLAVLCFICVGRGRRLPQPR